MPRYAMDDPECWYCEAHDAARPCLECRAEHIDTYADNRIQDQKEGKA